MHDSQEWLSFRVSNLAVTCEYYQKYDRISEILDGLPKLLSLVQRDLEHYDGTLSKPSGRGRSYKFTSEQVLRILICQSVENLSLRDVTVRIDDSACLRKFTRIHGGPMMDYTTICKLRSAISEKTWRRVNSALTQHAVNEDLVGGEKLRMDTTAVETNIHWPSDSHLLWDTYRVVARLIDSARELSVEVVGNRRLRVQDMKRQHNLIGRAARKGGFSDRMEKPYKRLIEGVGTIIDWAEETALELEQIPDSRLSIVEAIQRDHLVGELRHFAKLGVHVVWQASERVLEGRRVPAAKKLFSIFEPHTEMLVRGKAKRNIEYGHMVGIEQVGGKFITHYDVFDKKPNEHHLLVPAIELHKKIFGAYPQEVSADKGYWPNPSDLSNAKEKVKLVSIGKLGRRTEEETQRETEPAFMEAQKFRAGVEGTIAFLKRILGLARCLRKGWSHFVSNIGATIFAHNLLILARC